MISGGLGASGANLEKRVKKGVKKLHRVCPIWGPMFDHFGEKRGYEKGIVLGTIFFRQKMGPGFRRRSVVEARAPKKLPK